MVEAFVMKAFVVDDLPKAASVAVALVIVALVT